MEAVKNTPKTRLPKRHRGTSRYVPDGADIEHRIQFKTSEAAQDFVNNRADVGIENLSYEPSTNSVILLGIERYGGLDLTPFQKQYGQDVTKHEEYRADIRFIGEADYGGILQTARNSHEQHDLGTRGKDLGSLLDDAETKLRKEGLLGVEAPLGSVTPDEDTLILARSSFSRKFLVKGLQMHDQGTKMIQSRQRCPSIFPHVFISPTFTPFRIYFSQLNPGLPKCP
ncbi:MAG: hypothetical protein ACR2IH_09780 [Pyrinomonadaceae bacterium]